MDELNLGDLVGKPYGSHKHYSVSFHSVEFEVLPCFFPNFHIKSNASCNFKVCAISIRSKHVFFWY